MRFKDRADAGRQLAESLQGRVEGDVVVLALPRGGVPVAYEIAEQLRAPLDVLVVRKLGVPGREELAMGAVASGGALVVNDGVVSQLSIPPYVIEAVAAREREELERRELAYRADAPPVTVAGRTAVLVDDGLATGATMRAAVQATRELAPRQIVIAVPVAHPSACESLRPLVDDVVCQQQPERLVAVGAFYQDFRQVTDEEVRELLQRALAHRAEEAAGLVGASQRWSPEGPVHVPIDDGIEVDGDLAIPREARGVVVVSPPDDVIAARLRQAGLATLSLNLLTVEEERVDAVTGELRYDVPLLAQRLVTTVLWLRRAQGTAALPVGLCAGDTSAAAALVAAAQLPGQVRAVVSRGGRPDLAGDVLPYVRCPTLVLVGEHDPMARELHEYTFVRLHADKELDVVPLAGRLFSEPGALEYVADRSAEWFVRHLRAKEAPREPAPLGHENPRRAAEGESRP